MIVANCSSSRLKSFLSKIPDCCAFSLWIATSLSTNANDVCRTLSSLRISSVLRTPEVLENIFLNTFPKSSLLTFISFVNLERPDKSKSSLLVNWPPPITTVVFLIFLRPSPKKPLRFFSISPNAS